MRLKRLLVIPKKRLLKKMLGFDEIYTVAICDCGDYNQSENNKKIFYPINYSDKYWYADPLSFCYNNKMYIFAEAYDRKILKAHIAVAEFNQDIEKIEFTPVIVEPYHMSFPMVFEWDDAVYMLPETGKNRSINLYKAVKFPYTWECIYTLETDEMYADTIVIENTPERVIFLTSMVNNQNTLEVKYQKFAISKFENNYVIEWDNSYNAAQRYNLRDRNAGALTQINGKPVIPTQISTKYDYGVSMVFRSYDGNVGEKVGEITKHNVEINNIKEKNIIGVHTYSNIGTHEIIDLRYLKFSPKNQYRKLFNVFRK